MKITNHSLRAGLCVKLDDGRLGRVRSQHDGCVDVGVRRRGSGSVRILELEPRDLRIISCPSNWMSPGEYQESRREAGDGARFEAAECR